MPDTAATPNVFLDTQVFDTHQYDLATPRIKRLVRLVRGGVVKLFLTTVTLREIERHIDERAKRAFQQVEKFQREASILKTLKQPPFEGLFIDLEESDVREAMHAQFRALCEACKVTVLSLDGVSVEDVFQSYFTQQAPFSSGAKKSEFPDAFAGAALRHWCDQNAGQKMYVVTEDKDWRGVCRSDSPLVYRPRLDELLEDFADSVVSTSIKEALLEQVVTLTKLIANEFRRADFYFSDLTSLDVQEFRSVDVTIVAMHVIEIDEGKATVSVDCKIGFHLIITAEDVHSATHDPEGNQLYPARSLTGPYEQTVSKLVDIMVTYEVGKPENVTVEYVEYREPFVTIDEENVAFTEDWRLEDLGPDPEWET